MPAAVSASPKQGKPSIGDITVDVLYHNFLFGQRAVFGVGDFALTHGLLDFIEQELDQAAAALEEAPRDTLFHRYIKGELTDGIMPWEVGTVPNEMRQESLLAFWTVLELLRMRADGATPSFEKTEAKFVKGKRNRLSEGQYGPFVFTKVSCDPVVMCWQCKTVHGYDLVMALGNKPACPECGAKQTGPIEAISEGDNAGAETTK